MTEASLFFVIVNRGKANALLKKAQALGAQGGTVLLGEGTMQSRLYDLFGINQTHKEVLLMAVPNDLNNSIYGMLKDEFRLHKRFRGIAFAVPFRRWQPDMPDELPAFDRSSTPYTLLTTVVAKGQGHDCMTIAREAGAVGGTIMHARGAGVPKDFYFPLIIEPQKDMLLIVAPAQEASRIRDSIYSRMGLEKAGAGIIFSMPVQSTIGLYDERRQGVKA